MASKMWATVLSNKPVMHEALKSRGLTLAIQNMKKHPLTNKKDSFHTSCTAEASVPGRSSCNKPRQDACSNPCMGIKKQKAEDFNECPPEPRYKPRQCSTGDEEKCCPDKKVTCPLPQRPPQPCKCVDETKVRKLKECPKPCGNTTC